MDRYIFHSQVNKAAKEAKERHLEMKPYFDGLSGAILKLESSLELNRNLNKALLLASGCSIILQITLIIELFFRK